MLSALYIGEQEWRKVLMTTATKRVQMDVQELNSKYPKNFQNNQDDLKLKYTAQSFLQT